MEEFRPELKRVAGGINCAGKNGMQEFRLKLERVAGGINSAGKNGMEEFRPELQIYELLRRVKAINSPGQCPSLLLGVFGGTGA